MTRYSPRLAASAACSQAASLSPECQFAITKRSENRSAVEPLLRLWRRLAQRRPHLPHLALQDLSEDRLRDLGFLDGRAVPRRD